MEGTLEASPGAGKKTNKSLTLTIYVCRA